MKVTSVLIILCSILCLNASAQGHHIEVKIKGFEEDTAFLAYHLASKQYMQDTVAVKNGKVVFKGDEKLDPGIYLIVMPPQNDFFEVVVPSEDQEFNLQTTLEDYANNMKVTGSDENAFFYDNLQYINTVSKQIQPLQEQAKAATEGSQEQKDLQAKLKGLYETLNNSRKAFASEHPELLYSKVINTMQEVTIPDAPVGTDNKEAWRYNYYKKHYFDNVDFAESGLIRTPVLRPKFMRYMEKVVSPHYDSLKLEATRLIEYARKDKKMFQYIAIELLNHYGKSQIMCHDAVFVHIVDMVYRTGDAWWSTEEQVKKMVERADRLRHTMCGALTPPIVMKDTEDKVKSLYETQAEFTVLYFWDYDCGHCRKVTPALGEWYAKADQNKIALYTVSINGDVDVWRNEKLKTYGLDTIPAIHVQDHARKTGFSYYYDLQSTPRIFLLDKDKRIIAKQISVDTLDDILEKMMNKELDEAKKEVND